LNKRCKRCKGPLEKIIQLSKNKWKSDSGIFKVSDGGLEFILLPEAQNSSINT
jgi:hypothetical protein